MTTDPDRLTLHRRLDEVLGPEEAATLMRSLPVTDWSQLATKDDLAALEERMDQRFERIDQRFERIDQRFERIDQRFERIDERFGLSDERLDLADQRVNRKLDVLRAETNAGFSELRAEMLTALRDQLRTTMLANATLLMAVLTITLVVARL